MSHVPYLNLASFLLGAAISECGFHRISHQFIYPIFTSVICQFSLEGSKDPLLSMKGIVIGFSGLIAPS